MKRLRLTQNELPKEVCTAVTDQLAEIILLDYHAGTHSTPLPREKDEDDCCDLRPQID
jgi:hypothetical protein